MCGLIQCHIHSSAKRLYSSIFIPSYIDSKMSLLIIKINIVVFSRKSIGQLHSKLSLTVLQANNLALGSSNCKTRNHYCSVQLASDKCRTPSVKAKCWPSWNFQVFVVRCLTLEWILISSAMLVSVRLLQFSCD